MNPLLAIPSHLVVEKKRTHDVAFGGTLQLPCAKRTKGFNSVGCNSPSTSNSNVIEREQELIDLCSESSGSYQTAADDLSPPKMPLVDAVSAVLAHSVVAQVTSCSKFLSEISAGSSAASSNQVLDLSTKRKKRYTTITLSSSVDGDVHCKDLKQLQQHRLTSGTSDRLPVERSTPRKSIENLALNLQVVCLLGTGGYGKVFLVRSKENLEKYSSDDDDQRSESSTESGIDLGPDRRLRRLANVDGSVASSGVGRGRARKDAIQFVRNTDALAWLSMDNREVDPLNYYALKVIKKANVLKSQTDLRHLKMEQRILARVQHPFIVECYMAAQTEKQLFFISEYIQGGELFNLLDRFAPLNEPDAMFYMSEVLVALEYLHSLGIIYRDLKPENIMLTSEGHVKLVDFGLSRDNFPADIVTATKCGTKEYMAPEVFRKQPYGFAADWWSFGAVSFDLMTNKVPVLEQDYDKAISFPTEMSRLAKDLLKRLMTVDHKCRLGSVEGATAIARHPFFNGTDWNGVERKKLRPPYRLSRLPDRGDFSCFSRKVTSKKRRVCSESKKSFVDPQLQFHFENFDYVQSCDLSQKAAGRK